MNKRIALFFILDGVGGAERMTVNIAKLLPSDEWTVIFCKIVTPYIIVNSRVEDIIPPNFGITVISRENQLLFLWQMYKVIKKYRPNVVFASAMHINQRLMLLSVFFPKINFIIRNDNYLYTLPTLKQLSLKYTYRLAKNIIVQTEEMRDELVSIGIRNDNIHMIHNLLDMSNINIQSLELSPIPNDGKFYFVAVGRICRDKGFDLLLQAYAKVLKQIPNSCLYILGATNYEGGEFYRELENFSRETKITDRVVFTGFVRNPYKYIKNASVFVLSSRVEGLPNVLIESQYLGVPAAAFKCIPIIDRIICDGINGCLAEPENVDDLADAMLSASKLHHITMTYKPGEKEEFLQIFNRSN
jgi:glycosyltransferase involved in cell wall biosynthesis